MSLVGLALGVPGCAQGLVHELAHGSRDLLDLARRTEGLTQLLELLEELPVTRELCLDGVAPVRERMALGQLRLGLDDLGVDGDGLVELVLDEVLAASISPRACDTCPGSVSWR
jgi:hypothetical protein